MNRITDSPAHDQLRAHYLAAMGVAVYVPRFPLPGALPVRRSSVAATARPAVTQRNRPAPVSEHAVRSAGSGLLSVNQILDGATPRRQPQEEIRPEVPDTSQQEAAKHRETIRFTLNLWRVSGSLLVIDTHQPRQALPTAALLCNILRAVGQPAELPPGECLRWPILPDACDLEDARDMVGAFLASRIAAQPVEWIWIMGEAGYKACTSAEEAYERMLGRRLSLTEYGTAAVVLPSLAEMLIQPSLKRITWRAIRDDHNLS